jgi:sugar phosphate permease
MVQVTPTADYRRWQVKILGATWLAYVGYYFCRMNFYVVKKAFGEALSLDAIGLGHLGTAYLVGYAIGQFSSAYFGRRVGPKRLLLIGTGISIFCNVIFGLSQTFWTILIFMAINGVAQGTGWPGCIGSLGFWFKREQRGSILGVWSTCYQLGPVAAKTFAAWMLTAAGYQWSFFGAALVLVAIWVVVLILHPNTPEDVGLESVREEEDQEDSQDDQKRGLGWTRQVVISILLMGSIYFCIKFLRYTLFSWAPYFLGMNFDLKGDEAGYLSTVFEAAGFGGVLFAGFASDRLFKGRRASIALIMLGMMAMAFLLMATLGGRILLFFTISMGLTGFMLYGPDSLLSGVGAIDVGSKRGALTAAGIINGPILMLLFGMAVAGVIIMFVLWLRARAGKSKL